MPKIKAKVSKSDLSVKYYDDLLGKPTINGVEVSGDKEASEYGLVDEESMKEAISEAVNDALEDIDASVTITEF